MKKLLLQSLTIFLMLLIGCINGSEKNIETVEKKEPITSKIELEIEYNYEIQHGKLFIVGKTNLPNGAQIGISVENNEGYQAATKTKINSGQFKSEGFSNNGAELLGNYTVTVYSHFNKVWHDTTMLKQLNFFYGKYIVVTNSEIFGEYNLMNFKKDITIGSKNEIIENEENCEKQLALLRNVAKEINNKIMELQKLYENNEQTDFEIEIASWNRENKKWRQDIEKNIDYSCCPAAKMALGSAIINIDLLGMAYARIYRNGKKDISLYSKHLNQNLDSFNKECLNCIK